MKIKNVAKTGCLLLAVSVLAACASPARGAAAQPAQALPQSTAEPASTELPQNQDEARTDPTAAPTAQPIATAQPTTPELQIPEGIEMPDVVFSENGQKNYTVIAKSGLVVRSQPDTDGEKLGTLATDTVVQAIGASDTTEGLWTLVCYDGNFGWVSGNYLRGEMLPKPEGVTITEAEAKIFFDTYVCPEMQWVEIQDGMEGVLTQHPEMGIDRLGGETRFFTVEKLLAADGQQETLSDIGDIVINRGELQGVLDRVYGENRMDAKDWGELQGDSITIPGMDGMGGLYPIHYVKTEGLLAEGSLATIQLRVAQDGLGVYDFAKVMALGHKDGPVLVEEQKPKDWDAIQSFDDLCQRGNLNPEDFGIIDVVLFKDDTGVHLWGAFPEKQVNYPW